MNSLINRLFGATLTLLVFAGCASSTSAPPDSAAMKPGNVTTDYAEKYLIGVGDSLSVNVWRNPDLSVSVPVRPDGMISVPLAGDVPVGDKTPEEVAAYVTEQLRKFIRDPHVTVIVTQMGSDAYRSRVRVTGAIKKPVSVPYRQGMTVLDMVLEAGGLTDFAVPGKAKLYRRSGESLKIELDRILQKGDMETNYAMQPGDVITVPERAF
ncbi:MAG: polysaccharide biosynthesis/export family protein [Pseudomonadales bacterium]|nr:polysaccharide biosynthesis/export family protein [Pseudomonadales bacterium]